jgi:hypothetical protein
VQPLLPGYLPIDKRFVVMEADIMAMNVRDALEKLAGGL